MNAPDIGCRKAGGCHDVAEDGSPAVPPRSGTFNTPCLFTQRSCRERPFADHLDTCACQLPHIVALSADMAFRSLYR